MMSPSLLTTLPLFQVARADTVVMVSARDAFDWVEAGGVVLILALLFALLGVLVRVLGTVEAMRRSVKPLVDRADKGLEPVLERARSVSENVDYVSHVVRQDVENLTEAIDRIRGRLDQASDRMEERIEEFNALMELVQSEAEDIFIDTAATVRGVRAGSRSLAERDSRPHRDGTDSSEGGAPSSGGAREGHEEPRPGPAPAPGADTAAHPGNTDGERANVAE